MVHFGPFLIRFCLLKSTWFMNFFKVGFCCGYLIYILEVSDTFWPGVLRTKVLGLILPLLFFLTLIPDLGRLANLSLAAQISNLLAFTVVFWFDFDHLHYVTDLENRTEFDWNGLPGFFSIAIYCFEVSLKMFIQHF